MEINKTAWQVTVEDLFKSEYDIPNIPLEQMTDAEKGRVKQFYGKFSEPTALYMELATRIIRLSQSNESGEMSAYSLMYDAYLLDQGSHNGGHIALDCLVFTYYILDQPDDV